MATTASQTVLMNQGVEGQIATPVYSHSDSVYEGGSLLTAKMKEALPNYLDDCDNDPMVFYRFYCNGPFGEDTDHYVLCGCADTKNRSRWADDFMMEVFVNGELGAASLREIEAIKTGPFGGWQFERDRHFVPCRLSQLKKRFHHVG